MTATSESVMSESDHELKADDLGDDLDDLAR